MVSSKDTAEAEKIFKGNRQFLKELLDHLYAQAAEAGRYPSPERMIFDQLLPLVEVAILRDQPAHPPDQDFTDLQARLGSKLYKLLWDDAVAAYFRHRPGFIKGKPGRPQMDAEAQQPANPRIDNAPHNSPRLPAFIGSTVDTVLLIYQHNGYLRVCPSTL
jgi:hypothetical protein